MSQNQAILKHLQQGNHITPLQAMNLFGCVRLAARVHDLKEMGHRVEDKWVHTKSDKRVKQYFIKV